MNSNPNLRRVLQAIWKRNGVARIELAETLKLDKSTITKIVSTLMRANLVYEGAEGEAGPAGGRKPVALRVRRDFGCFLGIEIQTEHYHACLIDPLGELLAHIEGDLSFGDRPLRSVALDTIIEILERIGNPPAAILGIGLGLSGIIDSQKGLVRWSIPLSVREPLDLGTSLGGLVSVPLRLENDARCCCWSELIRRRSENIDDFMFLLGEFRRKELGEGRSRNVAVGMAFVLNGCVHRGMDGTAGEFRSIFRDAPTESQFSLPDSLISDASESAEAFERVVSELGENIGLLVNTLDLRHVVVCGVFDRHKEVSTRLLQRGITKNTAYPGAARCDIVYSGLGGKVVAYGAAAMLACRLFAEPGQSRPKGY